MASSAEGRLARCEMTHSTSVEMSETAVAGREDFLFFFFNEGLSVTGGWRRGWVAAANPLLNYLFSLIEASTVRLLAL